MIIKVMLEEENLMEIPPRNPEETTPDYLLRLQTVGFLFHGSTAEIQQLEPRPTVDRHSAWNTDTAVFASNRPILSVIFGIWGGHKGWKTSTHEFSDGRIQVIATLPTSAKAEVENTVGHVYVLSPIGFEIDPEGGVQRKSKMPVIPLASVDVRLQDFTSMGGEVKWE